jgi:hypothetical protein
MNGRFAFGGRWEDGRFAIGGQLGEKEVVSTQLTVGSWQLATIKKLYEVCSIRFIVRLEDSRFMIDERFGDGRFTVGIEFCQQLPASHRLSQELA